MSSFIVNVLGKDLTFTGRTLIWEKTLLLIWKKPLLGYGYTTYFGDYVMLGSFAPSGAHNFFLDVLFRGGAVLLIILICIVICLCKVVDKEKTSVARNLTVILFSYFIIWQVEVFINYGYVDMFFAMCVIVRHSELTNYRMSEVERENL